MLNNYISWLLRRYKFIVVLSLLFVTALAIGVKNLSTTNDFRIYFSKDNPQLVAFETLEKTFGKQDTLFFFIEPKDEDIFSQPALSLIWQLTEKAWNLPNADRVNSITNYQHTTAVGDDLITDYLLNDITLLSPEKISSIKNIVLNEPTLINFLTNEKGSLTGIQVQLDLDKGKTKATDETVVAARKLRQEFEAIYPDIKIHLGGSSTAGVSLGEAVERDIESLVIWSYLVIITMLLILLRSIRGTIATVLLISFSTLATMGIYGWFNFVLTPVAGWVPSIVMTIAVADSVHILISYFHGLRHGLKQHDAIRESLRINFNPVFITSITTIIGVLCLNFSDSPPYRELGNMVALGVFIAFVLSMTFLPAILTWLSIGKSHIKRGDSRSMDQLANWVIKQRRVLLSVMIIFTVVIASYIPNNELTERWHEYFDHSFEIRNTVELVNDKLTGVHYLRYLIESNEEGGIHEPQYLQTLDNFSDWLKQQNKVAYVSSLADISKRLNKTLHEDNHAFYTIPNSRQLASQIFLLYELGLPRELNLDTMVNHNRSATMVTVVINKTDSEFLLQFDQHAQQWLKQNASKYMTNEASGLDMIFAHINHRNIRSLLKGTLVALVLISIVLIFALQSLRLGLISLVPNLIPAALAYGTWGLFIGKIDLSASIVICMSLGIVVDDTVHFLSKYLRARREKGYDVNEGMRYAFNTVGIALIITTVVLVSGFLVLAGSPFSPTWVSGLLLAITLSYALLTDFFLLPPLLTVLDTKLYK